MKLLKITKWVGRNQELVCACIQEAIWVVYMKFKVKDSFYRGKRDNGPESRKKKKLDTYFNAKAFV